MRLPRLLLVTTDESAARLVTLVEAILPARLAGEFAVMVRAPSLAADDLQRVAQELIETCQAATVRLIINGDYALAGQLGSDVHLREASPPTAVIRAAIHPARWVGRSCHNAAGVARAEAEGATYVTLGPVGVVAGKAPPLTEQSFSSICELAKLPVYALGGVTLGTSRRWLDAGAHGVAIMRSWCEASDPASTVRDYLQALARP